MKGGGQDYWSLGRGHDMVPSILKNYKVTLQIVFLPLIFTTINATERDSSWLQYGNYISIDKNFKIK